MCVFSAASPPKKHTLVLFEAAGGRPKKNILLQTRYLKRINLNHLNLLDQAGEIIYDTMQNSCLTTGDVLESTGNVAGR